MITSYKIELKPNKKQIEGFRLNSGVARHAYNWALEKQSREYELYKTSGAPKPKIGAWGWATEFIQIKNNSDWMKKCSKWTPAEALANLEKAFDRFFKGIGNYPKRKKGNRDSFTVRATFVDFSHVYIPKIGKVRMKRKGFATDKKVPVKSITITREADRWFATFYVETNQRIPNPLPKLTNLLEQDIVGLDLGIKDLGISSDSQVFPNPKAYKKYQQKLARYQRKLARQQIGSKNRNKTKTKLQRLYRKMANIRKDCSNKMTSTLTKSSPKMLVVETLKPKNMSKNHKLAGAILDSAFGEINRQLKYKSELQGIHLVKAPQFYASSKFCSCCGAKKNDLKLSDRVWKCSSCGKNHDRDFNAAKNLQFYGTWLLAEEKNTEGCSEIQACGDERLQFLTEQCSSMKQEFLNSNSKLLEI